MCSLLTLLTELTGQSKRSSPHPLNRYNNNPHPNHLPNLSRFAPNFFRRVSSQSLFITKPPAPEPEPAAVPPPPVQSTSTKALTPIDDEEVAKRKARAARFNIDYVAPKESSPQRQRKEKISIVSSSDVSDCQHYLPSRILYLYRTPRNSRRERSALAFP